MGKERNGVGADNVANGEDESGPGVLEAILEAEICPESEDGCLAHGGLVIVLERICKAQLRLNLSVV